MRVQEEWVNKVELVGIMGIACVIGNVLSARKCGGQLESLLGLVLLGCAASTLLLENKWRFLVLEE